MSYILFSFWSLHIVVFAGVDECGDNGEAKVTVANASDAQAAVNVAREALKQQGDFKVEKLVSVNPTTSAGFGRLVVSTEVK